MQTLRLRGTKLSKRTTKLPSLLLPPPGGIVIGRVVSSFVR